MTAIFAAMDLLGVANYSNVVKGEWYHTGRSANIEIPFVITVAMAIERQALFICFYPNIGFFIS